MATAVLGFAAFACTVESNGTGAGTPTGGQATTAGVGGGSAGSSVLPTGGSASPMGGSGVTTGGGGASGGSTPAGGSNVGGSAGVTNGGAAMGGGNDTGMDTMPVRPLMINPSAAANNEISFTAKQLDPMAGTSPTDTFADAQEKAVVDTRKPKIQGKLVLTMGGIGTCCGQGGIGGFAVGLGFHHMAIAYQTKISGAPDKYKNVPDAMRTDDDNRQMGDARLEAWDGMDRVDWLTINEHDSFAYRTAVALKYMQTQDPGGDWAYFLNADGSVRWSDVYLVGYSYGSQTLAVIAKYVRIGRGIATSGPEDEGFPHATWITHPSATPLERMIGLFGSDNLGNKVDVTTAAGWLGPAVNVAANQSFADLMNGHLFILAGQGHSEFCAGDGGTWKALCQYSFGVMQ